MDKLKMQTENIADKNFKILSKMFPNALTETITGYDDDGEPIVERAIDADVLRQEISCKVVEEKDERYQFTWPDKKKTMALSNEPVSLTLRPNKDKSVNFQNTQNIYIEGDNLDVLKILQETYLDRIKLIYILIHHIIQEMILCTMMTSLMKNFNILKNQVNMIQLETGL